MQENFGDRLANAVMARGNPVVVGLDPRKEQIPSALLPDGSNAGAEQVAAAYETFCRGIIDVVGKIVPAVKPQAAFFEQLGPAGSTALFNVIRHAREAGLLVILDGKRNDIASTAAAYAEAYLSSAEGSFSADALTVSPYLGDDSLTPFLEVAGENGGGIFVLVKTSNPGSGRFQDLVADGEPLYLHVAKYVDELAGGSLGSHGYGTAGGVVGATYPEMLSELREAMPRSWLLVPGYGSQGGKARDVAGAFDDRGLGAVVNNSRGIIFAYRKPEYAESLGEAKWQEAVEAATRAMIDELAAETTVGKLATG